MRRNKIALPQLATITIAGFSIMALFGFPGDLAREAGRSSAASIGIMWVLTIISTLLIMALAIRFPGKTVHQYSKAILGTIPGTLVLILLALFHLFTSALVAENYARVVHTHFLPRTPEIVVLVSVLLASTYIASLGLQAVGRTCEIMIPPVYAVFGFLLLLGITQMDAIQLTPTLFKGISPILNGVFHVYYPFLAPQILYLVPAFLDGKPNKATPWALLAVGLNIALVTAVFILVVGTLGVDTPRHVRFPAILAVQLVSLPGFLIENIGYIVAIAWTILVCLYLSIQLWGQAIASMQAFNLSSRYQPLLLPLYAIAVFIVRLFFAGHRDLGYLFNWVISPLGLVWALIFPTLLLLIALIRGVRGGYTDKASSSSNKG